MSKSAALRVAAALAWLVNGTPGAGTAQAADAAPARVRAEAESQWRNARSFGDKLEVTLRLVRWFDARNQFYAAKDESGAKAALAPGQWRPADVPMSATRLRLGGAAGMRQKLRGLKRQDIQLDFDLYRVNVPIRGVPDAAVRRFLQMNLERAGDGFRWRINGQARNATRTGRNARSAAATSSSRM